MESKLPDSHPYPPSDFNEQNLPVSYREGLFYRLNPASYASAIYYDVSGMGRFDLKNKLGVLYLGESIEAAFIESFGRVLGQRYVSREFVKSRNLFTLKSDRPLQLLNLYGAGLSKLGADSELSSSRDYALSRAWSQAIYNHSQQVDGILYLSRHDNTRLCCGLFNRGDYQLIEQNLGDLISYDEQRFYQILDLYEFGTD
jgi:hypothetical protein